ncbi:hypothetical protein POM88_004163 [Heracleum sosnowskyi]|uniref:Uncharacterized protein n=1 Tax=Heracleum sosnowskyi TaxID=360622 RepID=A0AAD8JIU4_9APIA|nr:hypothetical protein POM88_004163 [Heracleum sosnowskyi]
MTELKDGGRYRWFLEERSVRCHKISLKRSKKFQLEDRLFSLSSVSSPAKVGNNNKLGIFVYSFNMDNTNEERKQLEKAHDQLRRQAYDELRRPGFDIEIFNERDETDNVHLDQRE